MREGVADGEDGISLRSPPHSDLSRYVEYRRPVPEIGEGRQISAGVKGLPADALDGVE